MEVKFTTTEETHTIGSTHYKNSDLPNLRAAFVKKEFIEQQLMANSPDCPAQVTVKLLKGYEFSQGTINPALRIAEVYIEVLD